MNNNLGYSEEDIDNLIQALYLGIVSTSKLPKELYFKTANYLKGGLYKGYGNPRSAFEFGTPDYKLLTELRSNIYMFSGAKTKFQIEDISSLMYEGNKIIPLEKFKDKAFGKFEQYNEHYLNSEYNTALTSGETSLKWGQIERNIAIMPNVEYSAVIDAHTSPECYALNGLVLPADDKRWRTITPPNHFNCRCVILNHSKEDARLTGKDVADIKYKEATDVMSDTFKMNPYYDKVVFKDDGPGKHPYFTIEPKDKEAAKHNFYLPIPK